MNQVSVRRSRLVSHFSSLKCPWKSILSIERNYKIEFQIEFHREKWGYEPYDLYIRIKLKQSVIKVVLLGLSLSLYKMSWKINFINRFFKWWKEKSEATNGTIRWSIRWIVIRYQGGSVFSPLTSAEFIRFDLGGVFHITWGGWEGGVATPPQRRMISPCFLWDFDRFRFTLGNEDDAEGEGILQK